MIKTEKSFPWSEGTENGLRDHGASRVVGMGKSDTTLKMRKGLSRIPLGMLKPTKRKLARRENDIAMKIKRLSDRRKNRTIRRIGQNDTLQIDAGQRKTKSGFANREQITRVKKDVQTHKLI